MDGVLELEVDEFILLAHLYGITERKVWFFWGGGGKATKKRTNSATSFALPLSESLCTLEVSFFSLLGFSEVAMV